jgi:hypothetical protein
MVYEPDGILGYGTIWFHKWFKGNGYKTAWCHNPEDAITVFDWQYKKKIVPLNPFSSPVMSTSLSSATNLISENIKLLYL